jgi:hypothetical protein
MAKANQKITLSRSQKIPFDKVVKSPTNLTASRLLRVNTLARAAY